MLGRTVGELERELTEDDVEEWRAYIFLKNEREEEALKAAQRKAKLEQESQVKRRRYR